MKDHVIRAMHDQPEVDAVVHRLIDAGFRDADISVRVAPIEDTTESPNRQRSYSGTSALVGAGVGAVLGGIVGLLAGMGIIVIPGAGPEAFLSAGPILGLLSGIIAGAGFCGVGGWIVGLAIVRKDVRARDAALAGGRPTVSVAVKRPEERALAEAVFRDSMA